MLREVLSREMFLPLLDVSGKEEVIDRLLDLVYSGGRVKDRELACRDIQANESRMSTGMQHGIAIPHAKSGAVDELVAAVATTRRPVLLPGDDREQARVFILLLSPLDGAGPHVRFLAEIGRLLRNRRLRQRLLAADTSEAMRRLLIPDPS